LRLDRQRPRQSYALLLAAGKLEGMECYGSAADLLHTAD
jgi:hypothetical protein